MTHREIEKSITKKYKKEIWINFIHALKDYDLIQNNDKIMVCISGGKDSMLLAKCMQEIKKHPQYNFDLKFIIMNPGYKDYHIEQIKKNLDILNINAEIFDSPIFDVVESQTSGSPCYLCARMRRGYLYTKAKELGCNKIALGHHFDDVIETIMLNLLYGAEIKTMMPKLHSTNFENMDLIRPLYLVKEKNIISWANYNKLSFINCACMFTEKNNNQNNDEGKRKEIKLLIQNLKKIYPNIDMNIFRSVQNVNLDAIVGYKTKGERINFLDKY